MNWYIELSKIKDIESITVCKNHNEWDDEIPSTFNFNSVLEAKELLDYEFDSGYGGTEGVFFTAWSKDKVYFPACYDGSEWIANVPRNPCLFATEHIGDG